jgi:hypothetical protein
MAKQQTSHGSLSEDSNSKDEKEKLLTGENEQESDRKEEIGKFLPFFFILND